MKQAPLSHSATAAGSACPAVSEEKVPPVKPEHIPGPPPDVRIPGGWAARPLLLNGRELAYWAPADPDAFLEDADVVAAHGPNPESPQRSDVPFWQYVWPSAEVMAPLVFAHDWAADWPGGQNSRRALELGAGVGVVGLAGLAAGISVTFSDYQAPALQVAAWNARQNGFSRYETRLLDWHDPPAERFPIIWGSDVIYERAIHQPILNVLDQMLAPGGVAWLGDPGRSGVPGFITEAQNRGYSVELRKSPGTGGSVSRCAGFQLLILRAS